MRKLHISDELSLPGDAITQKFAILGRTGSGKSYCATKLCEEMLDDKAQVIALDPVGVWYGLRVGAHYDIPIFGGLHGDVPLEYGAGAFIANLIVDRGISAVLDVSQFESDAQKAKFARDFATRFFFRKKSAPSAVHVFLEEAQEFVPQNPQREEADMLHAFHRIAKLGRNFGIGVTLITQRPQEVNKKALNQTECLFAFQMTGPQERKAIENWIAEKGVNEDITAILPHLKVGQCHIWSPQWLEVNATIKIAKKKTADVSSTPKAGAGKKAEPRPLSQGELETLSEEMLETIERSKSEDPKHLRAEVGRLKAELAKRPLEKSNTEIKTVERFVLKDGELKRLEEILERARNVEKQLSDAASMLEDQAVSIGKSVAPIAEAIRQTQQTSSINTRAASGGSVVAPIRSRPRTAVQVKQHGAGATGGAMDGDITAPQQRILDALAMLEGLGLNDVAKSNAAVFADQSPTSSGYQNNLGRLRSIGLIHYPQQGRLALTDDGRKVARNDGTVLSRLELHDAWFSKLPAPKVRILEVLIRNYPEPVEKAQLAEWSGQSPTSSGYQNNLGNLRSLGLVDYPCQGFVAATDLLFPAGLQ